MVSTEINRDGERLQKTLASAGLGSRREVEHWILGGRLAINGQIAKLGDRVRPGDRIALDGTELTLDSNAVARPHTSAVLIYHKPIGEMTTRSDPEGRPTVFERLPPVPAAAGRWIVVGRLDFTTSGLLLFTNDGDLAHRLMHPSSEIAREYRVTVEGLPERDVLERLRRGIRLEDGWANFDRVETETTGTDESEFRVVLREGRNREVRRMWSAAGHEVRRLARIRFGGLELPKDLRPAQFRLATPAEIDALRLDAQPR